MPFKALLKPLMEHLPGAQGAIIVDWEGEAVDQIGSMDEYELKVIGAHKGVILQNIRATAGRLNQGSLLELVITTSAVQILVMPVTQDYFLVLALDRTDHLGRARFEARRCVLKLYQEIA